MRRPDEPGLRMFADRAGYSTNVQTEVLSVFIAILILDRGAWHREDDRLWYSYMDSCASAKARYSASVIGGNSL
ncbi:MAG: hypothetical protein AAFV33_00165 [Chloroflexota bacterium]